MKQNETDYVEINWGKISRKLWKNKFIILGISIIFGVVAFIVSNILFEPKYMSTTRVYIINQNTDENNGVTVQDFDMDIYLVNEYKEIVSSRTVMENVIETSDLDITPNELFSKITIGSPANTRIVSISVTDTDPDMANKLANGIRDVANEEIERFNNNVDVITIESANLPSAPFNSLDRIKNAIKFFFIGGFFTSSIIIFLTLIDDNKEGKKNLS